MIDLTGWIEGVRTQQPLVHHITNYVTVNDCANITLAIGASPIMADAAEEAAEIAAMASAVVLNIGTLNARTIPSMIEAGRCANRRGAPVILDPVGAGASRLRGGDGQPAAAGDACRCAAGQYLGDPLYCRAQRRHQRGGCRRAGCHRQCRCGGDGPFVGSAARLCGGDHRQTGCCIGRKPNDSDRQRPSDALPPHRHRLHVFLVGCLLLRCPSRPPVRGDRRGYSDDGDRRGDRL